MLFGNIMNQEDPLGNIMIFARAFTNDVGAAKFARTSHIDGIVKWGPGLVKEDTRKLNGVREMRDRLSFSARYHASPATAGLHLRYRRRHSTPHNPSAPHSWLQGIFDGSFTHPARGRPTRASVRRDTNSRLTCGRARRRFHAPLPLGASSPYTEAYLIDTRTAALSAFLRGLWLRRDDERGHAHSTRKDSGAQAALARQQVCTLPHAVCCAVVPLRALPRRARPRCGLIPLQVL